MLFSNERKHKITLPAKLSGGSQPTIEHLLRHLVDNVMNDQRKELFIMEDNVYVDSEVLTKRKLIIAAADRVSLF